MLDNEIVNGGHVEEYTAVILPSGLEGDNIAKPATPPDAPANRKVATTIPMPPAKREFGV